MMQDWKGDRIAMHREASDLQTINHDSNIGRATISQRCFVLFQPFAPVILDSRLAGMQKG